MSLPALGHKRLRHLYVEAPSTHSVEGTWVFRWPAMTNEVSCFSSIRINTQGCGQVRQRRGSGDSASLWYCQLVQQVGQGSKVTPDRDIIGDQGWMAGMVCRAC